MPGGPNENNRILLIAGKIDFFMSANTLQSFDAVANNVPMVAVAAMFQKDPQVFLTHPESKVTKLEDLKPLTLFVSKEGIATYFQWLKSEYGFSESKVKPYTFNPQPFLAEQAERDAGLCHLRALRRREGGGLQARRDPARRLRLQHLFDPDRDPPRSGRQEARPGAALRRCLRSIGWYNYLYGDNAAGNAMIKKLNPEMTDELLAYSVAKMKEYGIVDSGDTLKRRHRRHDRRAGGELLRQDGAGRRRQRDIDYRQAYTLRFVNKGVGLDLRPKN